jgi:hypothetical protein
VVFDLYDIPSCNLFLPFPSSEVTSGSVFLVAKELFFYLFGMSGKNIVYDLGYLVKLYFVLLMQL